MDSEIKIIECPRDAMQGIIPFIPTARKIEYINKLLRVGFDTIDFGSFVSPKAIPQMADTAEVLHGLDAGGGASKLLAIVANERGAVEASQHGAIHYLGFPLSISETFQKRNTNKSIPEALNTLGEIRNICDKSGKNLAARGRVGGAVFVGHDRILRERTVMAARTASGPTYGPPSYCPPQLEASHGPSFRFVAPLPRHPRPRRSAQPDER